MDEKQVVKVVNLLKKEKLTLDDLVNRTKIDKNKVSDMLKQMKHQGYDIIKKYNQYTLDTLPQCELILRSKKSNKLIHKTDLVTSDFHLNSYHCKERALKDIVTIAKKNKIKRIINAGDLFEGSGRMYKGQMHEIKQYKLQNMLDYVNKKLPQIADKNMLWEFISGNHDDDITDRYGINPIKYLSNERNDLLYLGRDVADIVEDGIVKRILHPEGGGAYALTYEIQKYIRNLSKDDMPDIIYAGHKHVFANFNYQGIQCVMVPSLQTTTPYLARKGIDSQQGCVLVDYSVKNGKVQDFKTELIKL